MPFAPFYDLYPDLAKRETRVLTVLPGSDAPLPPGEYSFIEMFCDEKDCDCRRAYFTVFSLPANKTEAVISWGWESAAFYKRWLGMDDPEVIEQMLGPILDFSSPISRNATALLDFVATVLLADPMYVERVKKHYAQFRSAIDSGTMSEMARSGRRAAGADRATNADRDAAGAASAGFSGRSGADWGSFVQTRQQSGVAPKVRRNDPCPCGSGKKFKNCCLT